MKNKVTIWLLAGTIVVYATASALSHSSATGVVKQRMDAMVMLGNQIKFLTPMLVENQPKDFDAIAASAQIIARHGGGALSDLFPKDSIKGPSEARPEIWSSWQEFQTMAENLETLGQELAESANVALVASVQTPTIVEVKVEEELSAWDQLSSDTLLGIKSPAEQDIDTNIASLIAVENTRPVTRALASVYTDILAVCSSCHTTFRRSK